VSAVAEPTTGPLRVGSAPATWYVISGAVDTAWRCEWPAKVLGGKVEMIPGDHGNKLLTTPHDFSPFRWKPTRQGASYPDHEGVAVWTRPCQARGTHALEMQRQGYRTLAEMDDNFMSKPHLNVFMRESHVDDLTQLRHLKALAVHDGIVFSTRWLRDEYARNMRKLLRIRRNELPELFVCGNHLPRDEWPEKVPSDRLRIGWMGSAQHYRDCQTIFPALMWARQEGYETVIVGANLADETDVTNPNALEETRAWGRVIETHVAWQDPSVYHRVGLPLDIGLAPLERNAHTFGKSDCKAIEYVASGAVPVLSRHPVYTEHWKHEETCLFASDQRDFVVQVGRLVRDRGLRESILAAATEYVLNERSDTQIREEWGAAL